jgi:hypothetical protein
MDTKVTHKPIPLDDSDNSEDAEQDQDDIDDLEDVIPQIPLGTRVAGASLFGAIKTKGDPDVVFVGAGPVGLWTAIQIKLLVFVVILLKTCLHAVEHIDCFLYQMYSPSANIIMFEKHQQYQRSHVLRLEQSSFRHCVENKKLKDMVSKFPKFIRTNELEDQFLKVAAELEIQIEFKNVENFKEIRTQFPKTKIFIGADGSHSIVRRDVFDGELRHQETLQCTAEIKYEVVGSTKSMNMATQTYPTMKALGLIATEHIGKEREGKSPVTLRLLIEPMLYEQMKGATFKSPWYFPSHKDLIPEKVSEAVHIWLNAKATFVGEHRVPGSERLTVLKLTSYATKHSVKYLNDGATVFLVGDSCFAVPFFRALNNGISSGTQLAQTVARMIDKTLPSNVTKVGGWLNQKIRTMSLGSSFLDMFQLSVTSSGHKSFFEFTPGMFPIMCDHL